jgi:hypothetical protein
MKKSAEERRAAGRLVLDGKYYRLYDGTIVEVISVGAGSMDEDWLVEELLTGIREWVITSDLLVKATEITAMEALAWGAKD